MPDDHAIDQKFHKASTYERPVRVTGLARYVPSLVFYIKLVCGPFLWLSYKAAKGQCDDACWVKGSRWFSDQVEDLGCPIRIEGLEHLAKVSKPCVIVANHMSTLETFLLPAIVRPYMPVTFVVKDSLVTMPLFGAVMRSRNPVVLGRKNPREDLTTVLREGVDRLAHGISLIIFPQSTRMPVFDPQQFNSIGEKLAKKAGVPIVPLALKTDAWSTGSLIKDIGPITAGLPVRFRFDAPKTVDAKNSKAVHEYISSFIENSLAEWQNDRPT